MRYAISINKYHEKETISYFSVFSTVIVLGNLLLATLAYVNIQILPPLRCEQAKDGKPHCQEGVLATSFLTERVKRSSNRSNSDSNT